MLINNAEASEKAASDTVLICPRCRGACRPHAKFCPTCGNNLMRGDQIDAVIVSTESEAPKKERAAHRPRLRPAAPVIKPAGKPRILLGGVVVLGLSLAVGVAYLASSYYQEKHRVAVVMPEKTAVVDAPKSAQEIPEPPPMPVSRPPGGEAVEPATPSALDKPVATVDSVPRPETKSARREARRQEAARLAEAQRKQVEMEAAQAAEAQRKQAEQEKAAEAEKSQSAKPASAGDWKQACNGTAAISRLFCLEKARWQHCRDRWNTTPECAANNPGQQ